LDILGSSTQNNIVSEMTVKAMRVQHGQHGKMAEKHCCAMAAGTAMDWNIVSITTPRVLIKFLKVRRNAPPIFARHAARVSHAALEAMSGVRQGRPGNRSPLDSGPFHHRRSVE
jgi:hypothetical protein